MLPIDSIPSDICSLIEIVKFARSMRNITEAVIMLRFVMRGRRIDSEKRSTSIVREVH